MKIGVLALQGAVAEHLRMLEKAGAEAVAVKKISQLDDLDGIIIPGGESTTIGKLMREYGFIEALKQFAQYQKPVFGTCAGLIVVAKEINEQSEAHLGIMDIKVTRNAFGRQKESFEADLQVDGIDNKVRAIFIRAPLIEKVGVGVDVLCSFNDQIVAARQGNVLVTSFHPELTDDESMHKYFTQMVKESLVGGNAIV